MDSQTAREPDRQAGSQAASLWQRARFMSVTKTPTHKQPQQNKEDAEGEGGKTIRLVWHALPRV